MSAASVAVPPTPVEVPCVAPGAVAEGSLSTVALQNVRLMHTLERIAKRFNEAGLPLMVLKGGALQLTLYREPDERPMADLDLLVRPDDVDAATALLEEMGGLRSEPLFHEDFFPRFYYEVQLRLGHVHPVTIDLHVRALRPLRLARLMPDDAFWARAEPITFGAATILVPAADDMLVHLAAHAAFHGNNDPRWLEDIRRWIEAHGPVIDFRRLERTIVDWHLVAAFRSAIDATAAAHGPVLPPAVRTRLDTLASGWQDRLALWHAPRDQVHLMGSALVNAITTPGWRFRLAYVRQVLFPDRQYMDEWSDRHQCRFRPLATIVRCVRPLLARIPLLRNRSPIDVRKSGIHGYGVYATRDLAPGTVIARYRGRPVERDGPYVSFHTGPDERRCRHEITGPLRFLNHYCRPNAELVEFTLVAVLAIRAGDEITIDYGEEMCDCERAGDEGRDA
ncbi:MAG: nucleotidyltransferase family protein [Phycisphaerae bacterium]|nr:nucleotidyltransferase family protein [Phycisphaerae bacterium]